MIYDYKNIPWHLFIRQEDIDKKTKLEELKKIEKVFNAFNKNLEETKQIEFNIDFFSLEPIELNLDDI